MPDVPITITAFGGGDEGAKVSPGDAHFPSRQDQAVWNITPPGTAFSVDFNPGQCPFAKNHFDERDEQSGKPTGSAGHYKYTLKVGKTTIDPRVIIP